MSVKCNLIVLKKISTESKNIASENLQKLREVFPNFVKDEKIDFDALKAFFEKDGVLPENDEKFGLRWSGKSNAFKAIRETAKGTLSPQREESKNWDDTENLFIEGDNLEVLKLLQKQYQNKVKMIYVDPPYNTGKDFVYKDNFNQSVSDYYEQTGQSKDGVKMQVNTEKNGRYHSDWLTMMYPRLFLARNLLKEDGVIFISIDDNEVANLRLVMDEVFGEENFVGQLIWQNKEGGGGSDSKFFTIKHEYILCYSKTIESFSIKGISPTNKERYSEKDSHFKTRGSYYLQKMGMGSIQYSTSLDYSIDAPDNEKVFPKDNNSGRKACWRWSKDKYLWGIDNDYIVIKKDTKDVWTVYTKQYLNADNEGNIVERKQNPIGVINEYSTTQSAKKLVELLDSKVFDYPKPVELVKWLIDRIEIDSKDVVLDFFSGSGTTAHAVMDLNTEDGGSRKWICVQLPEEVDEKSEAYKAGYKNIAEISRERIRRAGDKIIEDRKEELSKREVGLDIGFKALKLQLSNYRQWSNLSEDNTEDDFIEQSKLFIDKPLVDKYDEESVVYEILLKEGFGLNFEVEKKDDVWVIKRGDSKLVVSFESKINQDVIEKLSLTKEDTFVCFDSALDDGVKVNLGRGVNLNVI